MNLGTKIRELRKNKRLTQEELAAKLHVSPQAVSKWESADSLNIRILSHKPSNPRLQMLLLIPN